MYFGKTNGWEIDPSVLRFLVFIICLPLSIVSFLTFLFGRGALLLSHLVFVDSWLIGKQRRFSLFCLWSKSWFFRFEWRNVWVWSLNPLEGFFCKSFFWPLLDPFPVCKSVFVALSRRFWRKSSFSWQVLLGHGNSMDRFSRKLPFGLRFWRPFVITL